MHYIVGTIVIIWWKGEVDETLDRWNSIVNHWKLNRTKLLAIDCDVKQKFVLLWHLGFVAFVFMVFVSCLLQERWRIHSWWCLLNCGMFSLGASFVVLLLSHRSFDGYLSSYGAHARNKEAWLFQWQHAKLS